MSTLMHVRLILEQDALAKTGDPERMTGQPEIVPETKQTG